MSVRGAVAVPRGDAEGSSALKNLRLVTSQRLSGKALCDINVLASLPSAVIPRVQSSGRRIDDLMPAAVRGSVISGSSDTAVSGLSKWVCCAFGLWYCDEL